ncbi:MAG: cysteine--tRNA ligase [Candidatus Neomarinimicrobiota bacterium]|nr:MAG: cysteine--tRNA ligase [Candidatus Neomarinimicrobiota bacterium]
MAIRFYNTLTRKKEPFHPLEEGKVRLYTCGPTVYNQAHIGNFRTFLFEDVLKRFLTVRGHQVLHVMNITDVDDKTIRRSREEQVSLTELTTRYTNRFFADLKRLRIRPADRYPRATEHIGDMIATIQKLVERGYAYPTDDGSVYFSIQAFPGYGKLARLNLDQMQSTERIQSDDYTKDAPMDFALWKGWKPEDGAVAWDSPWGKGRPGWHIECSVMSTKYLGEEFDIHCGGVDNIFPHHENEIAQAECASGQGFARYWLHSEHLLIEGGKMSKSRGNFYRLDDVLKEGYPPEAIRYVLLNGHYRSKLNFSWDRLREATQVVKRVAGFYRRLMEIDPAYRPPEQLPLTPVGEAFLDALDDDLDVPEALAVFFDWMRKTNQELDHSQLSAEEVRRRLDTLFLVNEIMDWLPSETRTAIPVDVQELVEQRQQARTETDWAKADTLRERIRALGWEVKDTPKGPVVTPR